MHGSRFGCDPNGNNDSHGLLDSKSIFSYLHPGTPTLDGLRNTSTKDEQDVLAVGGEGLLTSSALSSTSSTLLSRVLGRKRKSISESVASSTLPDGTPPQVPNTSADSPVILDSADEDCVLTAVQMPPHPEDPPPPDAGAVGHHVVHEFVIPLTEAEEEGASSVKPPRGRGGRSRRGRGLMRALSKVMDGGEGSLATSSSSTSRARPQGWLRLSLADVLVQAATLDGANCMPAPSGTSWCEEVRACGRTLTGLPALGEVLRIVNMKHLLPTVLQKSWPPVGQDWQLLPVSPEALEASKMEVMSFDDEHRPGHCVFRAGPQTDEEGVTTEALHVRLCLDPAVAIKLLGPWNQGGPRSVARHAEWRVEHMWKRKKKKDTCENPFHLLDNRDDALAEQPPHFKAFPLRREQLRSLRWMQQCEEVLAPFDLILNQRQTDPSPHADQLSEGLFGWRFDLRLREVHHIRGGILGDAVGYGKTATTIGLIDSRNSLFATHPTVPAAEEPYFFASSATLVLVPSNLLDQWVSEIHKFLGPSCGGGGAEKSTATRFTRERPPLRVVAIRTASQLKTSTVEQLCSGADVVLCSYRLLFSPVYRRRLLEFSGNFSALSHSDAAVTRTKIDVGSLRSNTRRFRGNPLMVSWRHQLDKPGALAQDCVEDPMTLQFPVLEQFWWRRIVFDEFHELEAYGNSAQFESLRDLCGHYRWGLTGTPPTRDLAQIQTLATLFQLGRLPSSTGLGHSMAQRFLDHFARQNTSTEVLPVELCEHIVEVHQAPEERAIYLQAAHDANFAATDPHVGGDAVVTAGSGATVSDRQKMLLKLCSHFSYGATTSVDASSECSRLLGVKVKRVDRALHRFTVIAYANTLLWRLLARFRMQSLEGAPLAEMQRERTMDALSKRFGGEFRPVSVAQAVLGEVTALGSSAPSMPGRLDLGGGAAEASSHGEADEQLAPHEQSMPLDGQSAVDGSAGSPDPIAIEAPGLPLTDALSMPHDVHSAVDGSAGSPDLSVFDAPELAITESHCEHEHAACPESPAPPDDAEFAGPSESAKPEVEAAAEQAETTEPVVTPVEEPSNNPTVVGLKSVLDKADALDLEVLESQHLANVRSKSFSSNVPVVDAIRRLLAPGAFALRSEPGLWEPALKDAHEKLFEAAEAFDAVSRSHQFFETALAATRGQASSDNRSCSICLDEDIPVEELSITACAHVFHGECINEVAEKLGNCPVCRQKLDVTKGDVTPLVSELAAADKRAADAARAGLAQSLVPEATSSKKRMRKGASSAGLLLPQPDSNDAELAKRFGSKLAAMALRLREIGRRGEKALVFCQWEDLKQKVADALGAFGLPHFQLSGNVYQRSEAIRRFQEERGEGATYVLLLSLEHSASGTNLTSANHVVLVHPMSAASADVAVAYEAQAIGRCRRWGQQHAQVHCWRFVTRGTIEETITAEHCRDLWDHHLQREASKKGRHECGE